MTLHRHHRKRRSQGGDDSEANILLVTPEQHDWIHRNPALARDLGWLVQSWEDPEEVELVISPEKVLELQREAEDDAASRAEGDNGDSGDTTSYPTPGEPCLACGRRVPFPKTEKSPPTKKSAYWVPADEYDAHKENLADFAKFVGCYEHPFWEFKAMSLLLAVGFQDDSLRGFANRSWVPPDTETVGLA